MLLARGFPCAAFVRLRSPPSGEEGGWGGGRTRGDMAPLGQGAARSPAGSPVHLQTPLSTGSSAGATESITAVMDSGYSRVEAGSPTSQRRTLAPSGRRTAPGSGGVPWKKKMMVACGTLALVLVVIAAGSFLGVELGKEAVQHSGFPEHPHRQADEPTAEVQKAPRPLAVAAWTTSTTTAAPPTTTQEARATMTPDMGPVVPEMPLYTRPPTTTPMVIPTTTKPTTTTKTSTSTTATTLTRTTTSTTPRRTTTTTYFPSLFCFSIMRADPKAMELALVRTQLAKGASIFACEAWRVYSDVKTWLTPGPPVRIDSSVLRIGLEAKSGVKEHILNTQIFLQAWKQVKEEGLHQKTEWSVKVDPDAVFFPARLRSRLFKHVHAAGSRIYFTNCKLSFGLFGALEVFSRGAMETFYKGLERCQSELPWKTYGEDLFMRRCLDLLEVTRIADYELLMDGYCGPQPSPCTAGPVAFHPFKNVEIYLKCLQEAKEAKEGAKAKEAEEGAEAIVA